MRIARQAAVNVRAVRRTSGNERGNSARNVAIERRVGRGGRLRVAKIVFASRAAATEPNRSTPKLTFPNRSSSDGATINAVIVFYRKHRFTRDVI